MGEFFEQELCEELKKSSLCAKGFYDFERLTFERSQFLHCRIKEEKETLFFYYDVQEKKAFTELRGEKKLTRLKVMLEAGRINNLFQEYSFSLHPENLYYDRSGRMFIKNRDLYERGITGSEEEFLEQYKALIGFVMQKKYSFEDYFSGGKDLYRKNSFLKKLTDMNSVKEVEEFLEKEYEQAEDIALHKRVEVNKSWYRLNGWCMAAAIVLLAAAVIYIVYSVFVLTPRKNALINASGSYLEGNYVKVIDNLQNMDMRYMNKYQKYMLAVSYVKSESLTPEQKENVLETITIDGEEKIKDYWIYLGRLNTVEAQNIAMQRSDDELLLYAYMTEKAVLEKNTEITGEEKASRLSELQSKIENLAKQYEEAENIN